MEFSKFTCPDFVEALASASPVPGGGGASALVGAIGTALGSMVASLTVGKKKYADVEAEIVALKETCAGLQRDFLELIDLDAEGFEPLSAAYRLPKDTEQQRAFKAQELERLSVEACGVPLRIMERCCRAIEAIEVFAEKGSVLALSDAGVGALFCKAALEGASLNVFINTKSLNDRDKAAELNGQADAMLDEYGQRAAQVFEKVVSSLRGK